MIQQVEHKNYLKKNTYWLIIKSETSKSEKRCYHEVSDWGDVFIMNEKLSVTQQKIRLRQ